MRVGRVSDERFAGIVVQRPYSLIAQSILGTSEFFFCRIGISKPSWCAPNGALTSSLAIVMRGFLLAEALSSS